MYSSRITRFYDKLGPPRTPSSEEIKLICQMFDGAGVFEVSLNAPFLIIRCHSLPPKPWPLTIGGIPIWLTDSATGTPLPQGSPGHSQPVLPDLRLSNIRCPPSESIALISKFFTDEYGILISEIMWTGPQLHLRVPPTAQISSLPCKISNLVALYNTSSLMPNEKEIEKSRFSP